MFSPLHSVTNEEHYMKDLRNQSTQNGKLGQFPLHREAIMIHYCELTPFAVSKDKWDTKEDTGKSMKNVLYVVQYAKRHQ